MVKRTNCDALVHQRCGQHCKDFYVLEINLGATGMFVQTYRRKRWSAFGEVFLQQAQASSHPAQAGRREGTAQSLCVPAGETFQQ